MDDFTKSYTDTGNNSGPRDRDALIAATGPSLKDLIFAVNWADNSPHLYKIFITFMPSYTS